MDFRYRSQFRYWRSYISIVIGLALLFFLLSHYGQQPFFNPGYLIILILVVIDVAVASFSRLRAPREFQIEGSTLKVRWRHRTKTFPVESVSTRKGLRWVFNRAIFLRSNSETFTVFDDLDGFKEFISIIEGKTPGTLPLSGPGQTGWK